MNPTASRRQILLGISCAALAAVPLTIPTSTTAQNLPPGSIADVEPHLRADKLRFAQGEQVFFWVGVIGSKAAANKPPVPIPKKYQNTCQLHITRPDGSRKTNPIHWPMDGPEGSTWVGGAGLGEKPTPGTYTLVFEFAGKKTPPTKIVVERLPILAKIHATFVFGPPKDSDQVVTLLVRNDTDQTIRFPKRGKDSQISNSDISVALTGLEEKRKIAVFYPEPPTRATGAHTESRSHYDSFTWAVANKISPIELKPGASYALPLSLRAAVAEARLLSASTPTGKYEVAFSTVLPLLIGEPGGALTDTSPVRLVVESAEHCTLPRNP